MFYGLSSLFSLLLYGVNVFANKGYTEIFMDLFNELGAFVYWFGGHIFGTEQFYNSITSPEELYSFYAWGHAHANLNSLTNIWPALLGLIASIIVVWGLVRLIVKVCSLGKITY